MRFRLAFYYAVFLQLQVNALMGRELLNDKRKAQLEDHLQRNQAEEGVVVTLLDGVEKSHDEQYRARTAENIDEPRQKGIRDRAVHAQSLEARSHHVDITSCKAFGHDPV